MSSVRSIKILLFELKTFLAPEKHAFDMSYNITHEESEQTKQSLVRKFILMFISLEQ